MDEKTIAQQLEEAEADTLVGQLRKMHEATRPFREANERLAQGILDFARRAAPELIALNFANQTRLTVPQARRWVKWCQENSWPLEPVDLDLLRMPVTSEAPRENTRTLPLAASEPGVDVGALPRVGE
jgi:hypothetical protein